MIDSHAHFWDPRELPYPWLDGLPELRRPFLFDDYARTENSDARADGVVFVECNAARHRNLDEVAFAERLARADGVVFVECNAAPHSNLDEVAFAERLARDGAPIAAIVAFADLTDVDRLPATLDALGRSPLVRGVRHNVQGEPLGFCIAPVFASGVREVGARGLVFELCATHDQLSEVALLVHRCPRTRFVLDHCGKPAVRDGALETWRRDIELLAAQPNIVACKLSGLLTEAGPGWTEDALLPYAESVIGAFGEHRLMYGSDWPVMTLAGTPAEWYTFTQHATAGWDDRARCAFYHDNAVRVYGL